MMGRMRLRPQEIDEMTLPEITMALDDDISKPRASRGARAMTRAEIIEHARKIRAMTPIERLRRERGESG